jgi:hypothetical protein
LSKTFIGSARCPATSPSVADGRIFIAATCSSVLQKKSAACAHSAPAAARAALICAVTAGESCARAIIGSDNIAYAHIHAAGFMI